jgi:hypothetical protein
MDDKRNRPEEVSMKHYVGLHHHRHGIGTYILKCNHEPSMDEFKALLGDTFEENREDEFLEIVESSVHEVAS